MLYTTTISNGNSSIGLAVRYYGYTKQISNQCSSIRGRLTRDNIDETEDSEPEKYNYMLPELTKLYTKVIG